MVTYTTVPALTDQDVGKVLLANYLQDGDPAGWFRPPFVLDKAFQIASNDGLTAIVAYRAGEPYSYTVKGIPLVTKTLKYAAIPSIESGLIATKDGTSGVAITAGVVRYLNSAKEWKEANVGAQTVLIGVPSTGVETVYIVAYDLETTPKIDAYKPAKSLFDAAPNAATVDPQEPAIIIARVDLDGAGNVIAIFNDGIHAGLEATKAEDLREMMGVIQHNIEPTIDSKTKTTLSYSDLPDRYIIGYTNFGKAKQDNRFPYIGAMVDSKPTVVNTEFMDSAGNAIIQASGNIASQELSRYTSTSKSSGERLKRSEFVLHPIFVYLDIENTPIINYAIVRSAVVFRKRPLAIDPFAQQIKKYMLEETLGNTEVPQFITDFCTLCGFLAVDDAMDLRTSIAEALIIPATEGFSSIQDRPSALAAPVAEEDGLLVVKEGDSAVAKGLTAAEDGSIYQKTANGFKTINVNKLKYLELNISKLNDFEGYNNNGDIAQSDLAALKSSMLSNSDFSASYTIRRVRSGNQHVIFKPTANTFIKNLPSNGIERYLNYDSKIDIPFPTNLMAKLFDSSFSNVNSLRDKIVHFKVIETCYSDKNRNAGTTAVSACINKNSAIFSFDRNTVSPASSLIELKTRGNLITIQAYYYYVSNENFRIIDFDLVGATVSNGQFTSYGTIVPKFNPKRFNYDLLPDFTDLTNLNRLSLITNDYQKLQRYFDTNTIQIKAFSQLPNFDEITVPIKKIIQSNSASQVVGSVDSWQMITTGSDAAMAAKGLTPPANFNSDIYLEIVWT